MIKGWQRGDVCVECNVIVDNLLSVYRFVIILML